MDSDGTDATIRTSKSTLATYFILFATTVVLAILGLALGDSGDLILTVPVSIMLLITIVSERHTVHVPTLTVMLIWLSMLLSISGRVLFGGRILAVVADVLTGVNLALIGIILVFMLLKSMPGVRDENPAIASTIAVCISMAIFMLMTMLRYVASLFMHSIVIPEVSVLMESMASAMVGAGIIGILFVKYRDSRIFKYTVNDFLESNSGMLGFDEREKQDIYDMIADGESDKLEFKSTVRTNLATGEVDKRMEKAVLKTMVAFLNTDGGTLLIGVSDDGEICGADLDSFENLDKMNLHMTNMISSAIGNGYIPYINFKAIEFDEGKYVIRVKCAPAQKAVFLREGKVEQFYVRSGPSSVELTGMNLVNYVNNRNRKNFLRRKSS
ncbi:MAG: ATP-binding protein [Candidatus Methanomethylophilaceae archaeon]|nr:ATP-binding protein [Candidatus Methanomethylophilaceae archaeon]